MSTSKVVLITGCSDGGIGGTLAAQLAEQGHFVFATARNPAKVPPRLQDLDNVHILQLDVTDEESITAATTAVTKHGKGLDVLVNNAGLGYASPLLDVDIARAKSVHDAMVWGPLRMVHAFSDLLIASKGRIVNIGDACGQVYTPWIGTYSSAKAALHILSETLRLEMSPFGVHVGCIMTGTVATKLHANAPALSLPERSLYSGIAGTIGRWARGEAGPPGGSLDEYVASIIPDVVGRLTRKRGVVWRGANVGAVWFAATWLPTYIVDMLLLQNQGIDELTQLVLDKKAM
ncbi:hypothetical protein VHEMI06413 [[Torrubiella] hemipterigena]|uniref:Uncharacterized protein n=1 Tax=[Torrubiella] hemipterigena TaxID=1531966 RepID=A0A0A1TJ34_9HYPO|nr:hypothetical protein VHEMI06413 [[Torrubiella] hemipterigena]